MLSSGLNPLAPVFVPKAYSGATVPASTTGAGTQIDARGFGQLPNEVRNGLWCVCSLSAGSAEVSAWQMQVLATVLSYLEDPKHVFACAAASRHLRDIAAYAPLRLHICQAVNTAQPKHKEDVSLVRRTLQGVCREFKGTDTRSPP